MSWNHRDAHRLDRGERAAIALALAKGCPLIIEERLGRRLATEVGLPIIGAAGLVLEACRRHHITTAEAAEATRRLYTANRIGKRLRDELLTRLDR